MRKVLILLLFSVLTARAQAPAENALLWEITSPGQSAPSYLFGTIHLICPADFSLSDSLKSAVARSRQVALELDMDDPAMMSKMMKSMYMTDGSELKKLVTEPQYARISKFYRDSVGMGLDMFGKAKPFVLIGPLFNAVLACQPQSYEMALVNMAAKQQTEVIGLETIEEQMAVFDSVPYKDQAKMIVDLIDSLPAAREEFHQMVEVYKTGNIAALYKMTLKSEFGMEGNEEVMLFERNKNWVPRIRQFIQDKPTFFAVGAAHLGGEKGVIALLRKEGLTVRPIKDKN